jgi:hypothetical protein
LVVNPRSPEKSMFFASNQCVPLARKGKLCSLAPPGKVSHATVCQHWGMAQSALCKRQFLGVVHRHGAGRDAQGCSEIYDTSLTAFLGGLLSTKPAKNGHPQHHNFKPSRPMALVCSAALCTALGEGLNTKKHLFNGRLGLSRARHFDLLPQPHHAVHSFHSASQAKHTHVATTRWEGINPSPHMPYTPA